MSDIPTDTKGSTLYRVGFAIFIIGCLMNSWDAYQGYVHDLNFGRAGRSLGTIGRERFYALQAGGLAAGVIVLFVMAYRRFLVPVVGAAVIAWFVAPRTFVNRLTFAFTPLLLL